MTKKPMPPNAKGLTNDVVWIVGIIAAIGLVSSLSKCSSSSTGATANEITGSGPAVRTLSSAVPEQKPPAVEPLSSAGASAGVAGMRKAIAAEGLTGAMIFSRNCYDGLSRRFSWRTLDVCGAADLQAVTSVPEDEVAGLDKEIAYFQSETAAGRYLGAATGAGITSEEADLRLAGMQSRVSPVATGPGEDNVAEGGIDQPEEAASGNEVDGASNQDVGPTEPDAADPMG